MQDPPKEYTEQEILCMNCLDELGIRYEYQMVVGKYIVDFYIPEMNIVIECDGFYGHYKKKDRERDNYLREIGIDDIIHMKEQSKDKIYTFLIPLFGE